MGLPNKGENNPLQVPSN